MGNEHTIIPTAVQKQDEAADAAIAALDAARSDVEALDEVPPTEEPAQVPAANRDDLMEDSEQPATPPTVAPDALVAEVAETKPGEGEAVSKEDFEKVKSRLDVLLGKYNSEVPRYAARVKELERENDGLLDQVEQLANVPAEPNPEAYKKYLTEEEQADLDESYTNIQVKMARGIAEEIAEQRVGNLTGQIRDLKTTISELRSAQSDTASSAFWKDVDALAPGAAVANASNDPGWVAFLGGVDPTSRLTYREIGIAAINRSDAAAVANLFNLYLGTTGKKEPRPPKKSVESQLKPGTVPAAPRTPNRPTGPIIKESDIKRFYRTAVSSGLSEADIAAQEAVFDTAASEGRIRFGT